MPDGGFFDHASSVSSGIVFVIVLIVLGLAILFGLALLPANIAKKKGYGFWGFFLFAYFLWLPALIVAACLADRTKPRPYYFVGQQPYGYPGQPGAPQPDQAGGQAPTNASQPYGAQTVYAAQTPPQNGVGQASPAAVACPQCGTQMSGAMMYCANCGARLK